MTAQSGLGFSGIVAIQIPDDGAAGEVLTKTTADNYDYDWAAGGGGGGGQVNTVVGGTNINVNAGDPINPIVNLDAALVGVSVNGVTLNAAGLATNFLNEAGAYIAVPPSGGQVDSVVGGTNINVNVADPANPIVNLDAALVGVSVNAVTLTALGVATNFLNETGVYSIPPLDTIAADALYLRLDTANDPLTGSLQTQEVEADTNQTRDVGTTGPTGRFAQMRGRLGNFLGFSSNTGGVVAPAGTVTYGANPTGIAAGNVVQTGTGITTFRHGGAGGNPFKPVATLGNAFSSGPGDTGLINDGGGSFLGGSSYNSGAGTILLTTTNFGNFTWAYAYSTAGDHTFRNGAAGGFLGGYSQGTAAITVENFSQGPGCFTWVRPTGGNTLSTINVFNRGDGGFLQGAPLAVNGANTTRMEISTTGVAGFLQGRAQGAATMLVSGVGGFVQGFANGANMTATGAGSFARGQARNGNNIIASGIGSFAVGDSGAGAITASALNSIQFGPGVNAIANSLGVGDITGDGLRLRADAAGTVDGDFFKSGGDIGFRSNGVPVGLFNQPSVTGSRAANAALASLLTQLAAMNIIADNTVV